MVRLVTSCCLALALAAPALALQRFEQYRIMGSEIAAVRTAPHVDEDPAALIITLKSEQKEPVEITLESDGPVEDCQTIMEYAIGDANSYIQITVQHTADTMNGVMMTECARISIPGY